MTERKRFFFEKKKQKTFTNGARAGRLRRDSTDKSLLLLFFRKEDLPYSFNSGSNTRLNAKIASAVTAPIPATSAKKTVLCMPDQKLPR